MYVFLVVFQLATSFLIMHQVRDTLVLICLFPLPFIVFSLPLRCLSPPSLLMRQYTAAIFEAFDLTWTPPSRRTVTAHHIATLTKVST